MKNKRFKTYLYKRNRSKFYQLKIVDTTTGEIKRISTKCTNKYGDAADFVRDYRKKYLDNLEDNLSQDVIENLPQNNRNGSGMSIKELIDTYIDDYRHNKMIKEGVLKERKAQYRKNDRYATNLLLEYFDGKTVNDITEDSINKFIKYCMYQREEKTNGERKNLAYASVNQALTALASILNNVYKKKDKVTILEFLRPTIEKLKGASEIRQTIMTHKEVAKIIDWYEKNAPHLAPMIKLLQLSGARRDEIQSIRWKDIDWDQRYIRVYNSKQKKKNGSPYRNVYFDNEIKEDLLKMERYKKGNSDYVFVGQLSHEKIQTRTVYDIWARMIKDLNLYNQEGERYRFHDFRRFRITTNMENGEANEFTDSQTGHKSDSCRKRYQIENRIKQREFVDRVSKKFKESQQEKEDDLKLQTIALLEKILDEENQDVWMTDLYNKAKELKEMYTGLRK